MADKEANLNNNNSNNQQHFQADVKELLNLVTHHLYSEKEIFLRELISNASDALEKLNFSVVQNSKEYSYVQGEPQIIVDVDKENSIIKITDNGIGMNKDEIINCLGIIANSETKKFISSLPNSEAKDSSLIGNFGVGFYSAFIVASKVIVDSRKANLPANEAVRWESNGIGGSYTTANINKDTIGTTITLYIKEEDKEFLEAWQLKSIIRKYSNHVRFPILMVKEEDEKTKEEDKKDNAVQDEQDKYEVINSASALWTRSARDISEEEYDAFYSDNNHDSNKPILHLHNKVEGTLEYITLIYIPSVAPFDLWYQNVKCGLKLYVNRVFIMNDAEQFLPKYLRFIRGIIDSSNFQLNVSRETLQSNDVVRRIKSAITKKVINELNKLSKNDAEKYAKFWHIFGNVLKEGPVEDFENAEKIAKLFRFSSTHTDSEKQDVSLDDYISRMKPDQEKIYYVTAESFSAALRSPYLEKLREKGIEVLLMHDRIDDWLMSHMTEYDKKFFQSVAKGALDLGKLDDKEEKEQQKKATTEYKEFLNKIRKSLVGKIKDVRISTRLKNSPSCVVVDDHDVGLQMQKLMKAAGQTVPPTTPILELNIDHALVQKLAQEQNENNFMCLLNVLFDQAVLAESGQLEDPGAFVQRVNELIS